MAYYSRIADGILKDKLEAKGAVLIRGPNMEKYSFWLPIFMEKCSFWNAFYMEKCSFYLLIL